MRFSLPRSIQADATVSPEAARATAAATQGQITQWKPSVDREAAESRADGVAEIVGFAGDCESLVNMRRADY
jgi:hypothetical protein